MSETKEQTGDDTSFKVVSVNREDIVFQLSKDVVEVKFPPHIVTEADLKYLAGEMIKWDLKRQIRTLARRGLCGFTDEDRYLATVHAVMTGEPVILSLLAMDVGTAGYLFAWESWIDRRVIPVSTVAVSAAGRFKISLHLAAYQQVTEDVISELIRPSSPNMNMLLAVADEYVWCMFRRLPQLRHDLQQRYPGSMAVEVVKQCVTAFAVLNQLKIHSSWIVMDADTDLLIAALKSDRL